jgi:tetratricopeptide (TPR) repeat protein
LVKKVGLPIGLCVLLASCVPAPPPPPNLYLENLPQSLTGSMELEERIQTQDAWNLIRDGRLDKAQKAILNLGPENPLYAIGQGYLALARDDYQSAEGFFNQAVENNPNSTLAHLGLVQTFQKTDASDKAFNELREVLKLDSRNAWARDSYEALKKQKTAAAVDEARAAAASGDVQKAENAYLRALHYSPESPAVHLALAGIYRKGNKPSSALVHLKAAATADPRNLDILTDYAETLEEAKQYERSLEIYEKILEIEPGNAKAREQAETLKNRLGIFELPSRYNDIATLPAIGREDLAALLAVKLRNDLGEAPGKPPIIVDVSASWAAKFILKVTSLGLIDVYANHTFQPRRIVTRADLAEALDRVVVYLDERGHRFFRQIPPERIQIADVTPEHAYYRPISDVLSYQIMELFPDRTFRPEQTVSGPEAGQAIDALLALLR